MGSRRTGAGRASSVFIVSALLLGMLPLLALPARSEAATTSFTFAAAGDLGGNSNTAASLTALAGAGTDLFLALGDLSYGDVTPESGWCDFVKSRVGDTYPFELVAGNHEDDGPDGLIANFAACLPDRIGNLAGPYAKEYYFDYPPSAPLARMIMISPALTIEGTKYSYANGTARQAWLSAAIDGARGRGIPWVFVGMHKPCLSAGPTGCGSGSALMNFLISKRVDLVLGGHDHTYQRGAQLAHRTACTVVPTGAFNASCVIDDGSDGSYVKGNGTVHVIAGAFGKSFHNINASDPEAGYFASLMGKNLNQRYGFVRFQVTASQLTAEYVGTSAGGFSDSFTIASSTGNSPPTASPASRWTPEDTPVAVTLEGHDAETCELAFSTVVPPSHGMLSQLADQPCASGAPHLDRAAVVYTPDPGWSGTDSFTFRVSDGTQFSTAATATVAVSAASGDAMTFAPVADATVKERWPASNYGQATTLVVDSGPTIDFLMKFSVTGVGARAVTSARLRLHNTSGSVRGGDVHRVADTSWSEAAVNWNNAPPYDPDVVASLGAVRIGNWYEIDAGPLVSGDGTFSLRVTTPSTDGATYASSESDPTLAPQLVLSVS